MGIESWSTEKRLLVFVLVTVLFLVVYSYILRKVAPPPPPAPQEPATEAPAASPQAPAPPTPEPKPSAAPLRDQWRPIRAPTVATFRVTTDLMDIEWSNAGAAPTSWRLLEYQDENGDPLELIPQIPAAFQPLFFVDEQGKSVTELNTAPYQYRVLREAQGAIRVEFEYATESVYVKKALTFYPGRYDSDLQVLVRDREHTLPSPLFVVWAPGLENTTPAQRKKMGWSFHAVSGVYRSAKVHSFKNKADAFAVIEQPAIAWAGVHSNFFLVAFLHAQEQPISPLLFTTRIPPREPKESLQEHRPIMMTTGIPVQPDVVTAYRIYTGPKDIEVLTAVDPTLADAIQYGFFGFFSKAILVVLKFCYHNIFPNYGVAILLVTLILRLLLWPLSHKMFVNAEKMKKIQPKIKQINEKYKKIPLTDPRRKKMNEELMKIYQEHGVNPLSGCLPMLLQIPILFGFYRLLSVAIELRQAPFIFWIRDLSKPDPYLITPILMGVSMILQQKLSPTTVDPKQQRISYIFSIIFTYMFANAQSGLVLYWLFNNVLSIVQQQLYHRYLLKHIRGPVPKKRATATTRA